MANIKLFYIKKKGNKRAYFIFVSNDREELENIWNIYNNNISKECQHTACIEYKGFSSPQLDKLIKNLDIYKYGDYYLPLTFSNGNEYFYTNIINHLTYMDLAIAICYKNTTLLYKHLNSKSKMARCFSNYLLNNLDKNDYDLTIYTRQKGI